jgi:hypothetical protein
MTFPVKLIHPDNVKNPEREISAKDGAELARLIALGWKVKE